MKNQIMTTKINTMKSIFTLIIVLLFTSLSQAQTELLVNPNFTSENYGWTVTQDFKYNTQFSTYNFDLGYAYLPQTDHAYGVMDQIVSIPSNTTSCTFSFYYKITSDEVTTTTAFDKCLVQIMDNSGNSYGFVTLSNLNESGSYQYVSYNIPSSFFGKQVTIRFIGDNDGAKPTIFRIDNCSMKATQTVVNKPDLTVTSSFSTPGSITTDGNTILLNVNFKNQGTGNSSSFSVKYFLSETSAYNSSTAVLLATQSYNALIAGSSSAASIYLTIPAGLSAGTKYILSYVDPSNTIVESNENNNIGAAALSVTSTPVNKPDLTVTSSFSTPGSITTDGNNILLNVNFKNQGTGNSSSFSVKYFLSETSAYNSSTAVLLATQSYNALIAGSSSAASIYLTIPAGLSAGTKYILSYVDPSNTIVESNENNNIGAAPLTITSVVVNKPDLIVTSSFSTPGSITTDGNNILLNVNFKNQGTGNSSPFSVKYFLSETSAYNSSTAVLLATQSYNALNTGSSSAASIYLTIPSGLSVGTKYILSYVDPSNAINESNENNNIGAAPLTITSVVVNKPDLIVTSSNCTPVSAAAGATTTISTTVKNIGTATSISTFILYVLSDDANYDAGVDTYLGLTDINTIAINGSINVNYTVTIPTTAGTGNKYILQYVDGSWNYVEESNENNNIGAAAITITSTPVNKPDLTVTSSFSTPGSITTDGNTILLNVNFKNQGTGNSSSFSVKYFLSETSAYNSATAVLLATQSYNALNTGSSSAASIYLTIPAGLSAGTKYILSYVDPSNAIVESNENNNIGAAALAVNNPTPTKPELVITNFTAPATSTPLGSMNVNCTIENIGGTAANNFVVSFHLSDDATVNAGDLYLGEYPVNSLSSSQYKSFVQSLIIPSNAVTGQKIIIASVDGGGSVDEQLENNNSSISYITINNAFIQGLEFNNIKSHLYWPFYNSQDNTAGNPFSQWGGQFNGSAHPWHYSNNHDLDNNGEADHHTGESYYAQDWNYNYGNDDCGMSFYAPLDGTIIRLSEEYAPSGNCVNDRSHSTAGNYFIILSSNGQYAFKACHFNELSSSLYVGKVIQAGDYLGQIGNTGSSDGTHAHCQLYKGLTSTLVSILRNYGKIGSSATDYSYACDFDFDAILDGTGGDDGGSGSDGGGIPAGVTSTNNLTLKIYPNPSDAIVIVQLGKQVNTARITVLDLLGKIVHENVEQNASQFSIITSALESAPYFIHIVTEDGEYTGRLIVQH